MRLEGTPESLYCVGRSCISWQLVPVPDGLGEEQISEGLTGQTGKRLATLKKYKKEQQDSFSIITQTEHLAVLLKW
jgi:hypothetical protein